MAPNLRSSGKNPLTSKQEMLEDRIRRMEESMARMTGLVETLVHNQSPPPLLTTQLPTSGPQATSTQLLIRVHRAMIPLARLTIPVNRGMLQPRSPPPVLEGRSCRLTRRDRRAPRPKVGLQVSPARCLLG